jgi:hypothetical protein
MSKTIEDQIEWATALVNDDRMPHRFRDMHKALLDTLKSVKDADDRMRYLYKNAMLPLLTPHFTFEQWIEAIDRARSAK